MDTQQSQAAEEWGGIQVGHLGLKGSVFLEGGPGNVLQNGLEQRLKVLFGKRAVSRLLT